jgi:hypothetical protein
VNIGQKAHIWSFSVDGPRGSGPYIKKCSQINDLANLLLVCGDCHKLIDNDKKGIRYTAEVIQHSKQTHERRIAINTGVDPEKKSHVLIYAANISDQLSKIRVNDAHAALFPEWYPAEERPTHLSMNWKGRDDDLDYWLTEIKNLKNNFASKVQPLIADANISHFSVFALAPMPLMMLLGTLLTDKLKVQTYQLHREPVETWRWFDGPSEADFHLKPPRETSHPPVLILSLSDYINSDRIIAVLGSDISIWEFTIEAPDNDFLQSRLQLSAFRKAMRAALVCIGKAHDHTTPLSIFPAIPVACAVELGRIRMPKAQMPWIIYDQNNLCNKFIKVLTIE